MAGTQLPPSQPSGFTPENPKEQQNVYSWLRMVIFGILQEMRQPLRRNHTTSHTLFSAKKEPEKEKVETTPPRVEKIILRRSIFFLITNLLVIEICFDAMYILMRIPAMYVPFSQSLQGKLTYVYFVLFIAINLFKVIFMFFATLRWLFCTYQIKDNEIHLRTGILNQKEKVYICSHTQEVTFRQGLFGRIFNYGSVDIYDPALNEIIYLQFIPDPSKYAEIIKKQTTALSSAST